MTDTIAHRWQPISDLPDDWQAMADSTLPVLAEEWRKGREAVGDSPEIRRFNAELLREVAIETGLIEGLYSIDRGTTETLIRIGLIKEELAQGIIDRSPDEIMPILEDQHSATEGLFDFVKQKRDLDVSYIKELHAHLTQHQPSTVALTSSGQRVEIPLLRGEWKQQPNNPRREDGSVHEYCPPEHVASEMDRLIEMHTAHEALGVAPDVSAAWLHHRFTQIHPFQDGNGRVARSLASLVFLRAGWFLLDVTRDRRSEYIEALELADAANQQTLVQLFGNMQEIWFDRAIEAISKAEATRLSHDDLKSLMEKRRSERTGLLVGLDRQKMLLQSIIDQAQYYIAVELNNFGVDCSLQDDHQRATPINGHHTFNASASLQGAHIGFAWLSDDNFDGKIYPFIIRREEKVPKVYSRETFVIPKDGGVEEVTSEFESWAKLTTRFLLLEWERHR